MDSDRQVRLLNKLQRLLDEQTELARQGRLTEIETLCEQTRSVVEEISRAGIPELDEFEEQRKHLARSYDSLRLTLSDQRDEVRRELNRIRKGRKTIGVYRGSIKIARK